MWPFVCAIRKEAPLWAVSQQRRYEEEHRCFIFVLVKLTENLSFKAKCLNRPSGVRWINKILHVKRASVDKINAALAQDEINSIMDHHSHFRSRSELGSAV